MWEAVYEESFGFGGKYVEWEAGGLGSGFS